jgi:Uma2 family endonuclease
MPGQPFHRFHVREYYRLTETGVLRPGVRVELLNGRIIDKSPTTPFHGGINKRLIRNMIIIFMIYTMVLVSLIKL